MRRRHTQRYSRPMAAASPFTPRFALAAIVFAAIAFAGLVSACQPPSSAGQSTAPAPTPSIEPIYDISPTGHVQQANVTSVSDGDTIEVELDGRRRLLRCVGLDAPEIQGPYEDAEPFGPEAAQANRSLVDGRTVFLETDVSDIDRNGRLLRYVWLRVGVGWLMVNREIVRLGFAEARDYLPDTMYSDLLFAAQREAARSGVGIWKPLPATTTVPR